MWEEELSDLLPIEDIRRFAVDSCREELIWAQWIEKEAKNSGKSIGDFLLEKVGDIWKVKKLLLCIRYDLKKLETFQTRQARLEKDIFLSANNSKSAVKTGTKKQLPEVSEAVTFPIEYDGENLTPGIKSRGLAKSDKGCAFFNYCKKRIYSKASSKELDCTECHFCTIIK